MPQQTSVVNNAWTTEFLIMVIDDKVRCIQSLLTSILAFGRYLLMSACMEMNVILKSNVKMNDCLSLWDLHGVKTPD